MIKYVLAALFAASTATAGDFGASGTPPAEGQSLPLIVASKAETAVAVMCGTSGVEVHVVADPGPLELRVDSGVPLLLDIVSGLVLEGADAERLVGEMVNGAELVLTPGRTFDLQGFGQLRSDVLVECP